MISEELDFNFSEQIDSVETLNIFRKKGVCETGILLENLLLQYKNHKTEEEKIELIQKIKNTVEYFIQARYLIKHKLDPSNWQSIFTLLKEPLKIDNIKVLKLEERNDFFILDVEVEFSYTIDDSKESGKRMYIHLKNLGYLDLGRKIISKSKTGIKIGNKFKFSCPFTIEEQVGFLGQNVVFYNLFSMWKDICIKKCEEPGNHAWYLRDRRLPVVIQNLIDIFFIKNNDKNNANINDIPNKSKIPSEYIFKYDYNDLDPIIVNILYNKYLIPEFKIIERKLRLYSIQRYKDTNKNK